jgi:uncharacterized SAM-binding protein YcdF (DUF218 family)
VTFAPPRDERPRTEPARRGAGATIARWCVRLVLGGVLVALLVVAGTAVRVWQVARIDDRSPADAIVVLGAAQYSGTPSSVFEARLEQAANLYREGVAPTVITVGGKQTGDEYTEAASGKAYLTDAGIPAGDIIAVEEGSDTLRSIEAVHEEMAARDMKAAVLVSDPWHSLRTRTMARDTGLDAWSAPTRQGPAVFTRESQLHGIARETVGLLWYQISHSSADFSYTAEQ